MDYLNVVLWVLTVSVALLSMQSHKTLGFHQKYINLCSEDDWMSYGLYIIYYLLYKNIKYSVGVVISLAILWGCLSLLGVLWPLVSNIIHNIVEMCHRLSTHSFFIIHFSSDDKTSKQTTLLKFQMEWNKTTHFYGVQIENCLTKSRCFTPEVERCRGWSCRLQTMIILCSWLWYKDSEQTIFILYAAPAK